jgi:hypothetical protein
MKCLVKCLILLMVLLVPLTLSAADVKIAWDAGVGWPVDTVVRIYEKPATGAIVLVGTSIPLATTLTIPNVASGAHTYLGRAFSATLGMESDDSNSATAKVLVPPGNVRATIVITITN